MKTAFLFSGQGAQYPGMMKEIYDSSPAARKIFDSADRILGRSITELCFCGTTEDLNLTHNTQPCLLTAEVAAFEAMRENGSLPDAVAGFSLGEYAALVAAGVLSFEDAVRIVQIRADAMQRAVPVGEGAMAAVMTSNRDTVERLCRLSDGYVVPANYNYPGQTVVSGTKTAVQSFCECSKAEGIKATRLPVSAPFHCKLMEPAKAKLGEALATVTMNDARCPIYMNVDAKPERKAEMIREKLILQAVSPVYWEDTVRNMSADGIRSFNEIGPSDTLTKFVHFILDSENKGE